MPRNANHPPILVTGLRELPAKSGGTHLAGQLGAAHILIVPNRDRRGQGDPSHLLLVVAPGEPEGQR